MDKEQLLILLINSTIISINGVWYKVNSIDQTESESLLDVNVWIEPYDDDSDSELDYIDIDTLLTQRVEFYCLKSIYCNYDKNANVVL